MRTLSPFVRLTALPIVLMLTALLLSACDSGPGADEAAVLPTIFELPTLTPSFTPSATLPPTETLTPTPTLTPTLTLTPTSTLTPTPAPTDTPAATNTPRATATFTLTFTPEASDTPTLAPTSEMPQIITFTSSTPTASVGGTITLTWEAVGDSARIDVLNQQGIVIQQNPVALTGQQPFVIPPVTGTTVVYQLTVQRGTQSVNQLLTIANVVDCPTPWFFANPPADAGCPTGPQEVGPGAFQSFQDGLMIYVNANNRNTVYALANAGAVNGLVTQNTYGRENNAWDGVTDHCLQEPPPGFLEPIAQFNWMACFVFGPQGFWINTIGWATAPIDLAERTIQFSNNGTLFVDAPGGVIYRLQPLPQGVLNAGWSRVTP